MKTIITAIAATLIASSVSANDTPWTDYVLSGGEVSTLSLATALDTAHNLHEFYIDAAEVAEAELAAVEAQELDDTWGKNSGLTGSAAFDQAVKGRNWHLAKHKEYKSALNTVNARIDAATEALDLGFDIEVDISGAAYGNPNRGWGGNFDIGVWTSNHFEEGDVATMYFNFDNNATIASIHEELSENILDFGLNAYTNGYNAGYVDGYAAALAAIVSSPMGSVN